MRLYGAIEKFEKLDDGSLIVTGVASTSTIDSDGEVITASAMRSALPEYMKFANVREMHQPSAVGKTIHAEVSDDGKTRVTTKIVDASAVKKIVEGVYKGFSIAGKALEKAQNIINRLTLAEISLVDRPANPECVFDCWKADKTELKLMPELKTFAKALKLKEDATEQEILDAIAKAQTPPAPKADAGGISKADVETLIAGQFDTLKATILGLQKSNDAARRDADNQIRKGLIADASKEGKVIPLDDAQILASETFAGMPVDTLKSMISKLEKKVSVQPGPSGRTIPADKTIAEAAAEIRKGSFNRGVAAWNEFFKSRGNMAAAPKN